MHVKRYSKNLHDRENEIVRHFSLPKQRESWLEVLVDEKIIKAWSLLFKMYMISTLKREQNE